MGNQAFNKAVDYEAQLLKKEVYPLISANLTASAAQNLKRRIYFAMNEYKDTGKDIKIIEHINYNQTKGDLKKSIGMISLLINCRVVFEVKKTKINNITYLDTYISLQTKGPICSSWTIAVDAQTKCRISL